MTNIIFRNDTSFPIYVAISRYRPDICGGASDWLDEGWYKIESRKSSPIGSTNNAYFYYYAEGNGYIWIGNGNYISYVEEIAFAHCDNSTLGRRVDMREENCNSYGNYTVPLFI